MEGRSTTGAGETLLYVYSTTTIFVIVTEISISLNKNNGILISYVLSLFSFASLNASPLNFIDTLFIITVPGYNRIIIAVLLFTVPISYPFIEYSGS